jgi:two-component system nitrate/nitrite response regulator NarL
VVGAYSDPIDALENLSDSQAQLVLVDYHLPGLSGIDVLTQLKVKSPDTKYLVLTVDDRAEAVIHAFEGGADGYLMKGQSLEESVKAIRNFLNGAIV